MDHKKLEWGALVTLTIAIIGGAFWIGDINGRLKSLELHDSLQNEKKRILNEVEAFITDRVSALKEEFKQEIKREIVAETPSVEITVPENGSYAKAQTIVRGRSANLPEDMTLWIIVYEHRTDQYYPQRRPADIANNGDWSCPAKFGGAVYNVDEKFDAIVIGIIEEDTEALKKKIGNNYWGFET